MTVKYWLLAEKRPWQLWLADLRGERGERKRCVRPAFKPVAVPTQVELAPQNADAKLKYRE